MCVYGSYVHSNGVTVFQGKQISRKFIDFLGLFVQNFHFPRCQTLPKEFSSLHTLKCLLLRARVSKFIQSRNVASL